MDFEEANRTLLSENWKLRQRNKGLREMLQGIVTLNAELREKIRGSSAGTAATTCTGCSEPPPQDGGKGAFQGGTTSQWQDSLDESQFRKDLQQASFEQAPRTSSCLNMEFVRGSTRTEPSGTAEPEPSCQSRVITEVKDPERLMGEIAFQLDRRILSHVFQGQSRFYGFTVLNVQDKIVQVSTHPLTGRVDDGYRLYLSQRHTDLMEELSRLGYRRTLHPGFSEFVVNTYGVLGRGPDSDTVQERSYNNVDFLRRLVLHTAPTRLLKDLLLLLSCLDYMARKDGKPLVLW